MAIVEITIVIGGAAGLVYQALHSRILSIQLNRSQEETAKANAVAEVLQDKVAFCDENHMSGFVGPATRGWFHQAFRSIADVTGSSELLHLVDNTRVRAIEAGQSIQKWRKQ